MEGFANAIGIVHCGGGIASYFEKGRRLAVGSENEGNRETRLA